MRYKVNCQIDSYSTIYYAEEAWNQIDLTLNANEYSQFKNLIFNEGETKVFYLKPKVSVVSHNNLSAQVYNDNFYVSGTGEFPSIQLAMTVVNGDIEISVKPFSYSLDDIYWSITMSEYGDDPAGDSFGRDKLENELRYSHWDNYLNPQFIENYFRKNITVEEVEVNYEI